MTIRLKTRTVKRFLAGSVLFYLLYLPAFSELYLMIPSQYILGTIFIFLLFLQFNFVFRKSILETPSKSALFKWSISILILSLYTSLIAAVNGNAIRFLQYIFCIVWLFALYLYKRQTLDRLFGNEKTLELIMILGAVQGVICLLMLIFPGLKEIAYKLHFLGNERNIYRMEKRIYGISNDYTYFTPCYHGFLAAFTAIYAITKNKKMLFAVPLIFLATFLNNRTGIIIFLICYLVASLLLIFNEKVSKKTKRELIFTNVSLMILLLIFILIILIFNPQNVAYTLNGVLHIRDWLHEMRGELYLPSGLAFLFGNGEVQAGVSSDFGYVNDMFIGGILYCACLYFANIRFAVAKTKMNIFKVEMFNYDVMFLITFLISNFKGQSMKSGLILVGTLFIKLVLLDCLNEERDTRGGTYLSNDDIS